MNGILNVYKEKGFTSFDVVAKLRGILREKKIGHTGTLDPDATGVLPVCVGNATKVCSLLTDKDKEYEAIMHLGIVTDTLDATGTVLEDHEAQARKLQKSDVQAVIESFVGTYDQMPPMYSALKVNGKKLCDLARAGVEVARKMRPVTVYSITIDSIELPYVRMKVHCSKGTYIRSLCADIGEKLGVGACMDELVRTRVSSFFIEESYTIAQIEEQMKAGTIANMIIPVDKIFDSLPALAIVEDAKKRLQNGNRLFASDFNHLPADWDNRTDYGRVRIYDTDESFVAIYMYDREEEAFLCEKMFKTS